MDTLCYGKQATDDKDNFSKTEDTAACQWINISIIDNWREAYRRQTAKCLFKLCSIYQLHPITSCLEFHKCIEIRADILLHADVALVSDIKGVLQF